MTGITAEQLQEHPLIKEGPNTFQLKRILDRELFYYTMLYISENGIQVDGKLRSIDRPEVLQMAALYFILDANRGHDWVPILDMEDSPRGSDDLNDEEKTLP